MLKVIFRSLIQIVLFKWGWSRYRNTSPILSQVVLINFECTCPFVPMNTRIDKFQSHHLWYCQQIHSWGEVLFHLHIRRKFSSAKKIFKKKRKEKLSLSREESFIYKVHTEGSEEVLKFFTYLIDLLFIFMDGGGG